MSYVGARTLLVLSTKARSPDQTIPWLGIGVGVQRRRSDHARRGYKVETEMRNHCVNNWCFGFVNEEEYICRTKE